MPHVQKIYDVIVVGAGPAGLMAAGTVGFLGKKVLLVEKNARLGEKLRITGGGRCNITNLEKDVRKLLKNYGSAEQALYSAFTSFGVEETERFFTERGLPLKVEAGNRAFPQTEKATDVEAVLEKYCREAGVEIITSSPVQQILQEGGKVMGVQARGETYLAGSVVLAVGGLSHPETGSTGDGFAWLKDLGHTVAEPTPAIVPLSIKDKWVKSLAGVAVDNIKIHFYTAGQKQFSKTGKVLFTHFGLSGPMILNSAKKVGDLLHQGEVTGLIDIWPKKDFNILDQELVTLFDANKNKLLKNIAKDFLPAGLSGGVSLLLPPTLSETRVHSITKEERKKLIHLLKALPFTVKGLMGFDRAVVADGGVPLAEVDMRTMRSMKYSNLYITGDLLNINRPSGGFSLQLCWTTGYVAGGSV